MTTKTIAIYPQQNSSNSQINQIQAYQKSQLVTKNEELNYPLPDYNSLLEITKISKQVAFENKTLKQKQLLLLETKKQYRQKLLLEETNIRTRVITLKRRQNIAQVVEKIRQSEIQLQNQIWERIEQYQPAQSLDKNKKHNLFLALISKITNDS